MTTDPAGVRGELVAFCLSTAQTIWDGRNYTGKGDCPDGSRPLLKILAGVPGDTVELALEGIRVNGLVQPRSLPRAQDQRGRPMFSDRQPLRGGRIPAGFGLVLAPVESSFDSRYFGLVPLADLHVVKAVYIFNNLSPMENKHETR